MALSNGRPSKDMIKFMQVLSRSTYKTLEREAIKRGITVQELIRAVMTPNWLWSTADLLDTRNVRQLERYHVEQERTYRRLAKAGVFKR
jgi:hypothetical protein